MSTAAETVRKRNANRAFLTEFYDVKSGTTAGRTGENRKLLQDYALWVFDQLSKGKSVELYGVGTWWMTYRKERSGVGQFKTFQPAQYVLKFTPSTKLKAAFKELAVTYPDPKQLPMNRVHARRPPGYFRKLNAKPTPETRDSTAPSPEASTGPCQTEPSPASSSHTPAETPATDGKSSTGG